MKQFAYVHALLFVGHHFSFHVNHCIVLFFCYLPQRHSGQAQPLHWSQVPSFSPRCAHAFMSIFLSRIPGFSIPTARRFSSHDLRGCITQGEHHCGSPAAAAAVDRRRNVLGVYRSLVAAAFCLVFHHMIYEGVIQGEHHCRSPAAADTVGRRRKIVVVHRSLVAAVFCLFFCRSKRQRARTVISPIRMTVIKRLATKPGVVKHEVVHQSRSHPSNTASSIKHQAMRQTPSPP